MYKFKYLNLKAKPHPIFGNMLEYIEKRDAVCITLFDSEMKNVILVKQYRVGNDRINFEIPAGLIEDGEDPLETVKRELKEETGYDYKDVVEIKEMPQSYIRVAPAFTTEKIYFYGAKLKENVSRKELNLDDTEDIEVIKMPVYKALNELKDMKTILGILYFKEIL